MKPPGHAAISLSIGAVLWAVTKSPYALLASFLAGVLIDLDHLVEYYLWFVRKDNARLIYVLHSYELLVPAFLSGYFSGWNPVVTGVSFAFLGHLIADQIANPVVPLAYFFTFRAIKRFRRRELVRMRWDEISKDFLGIPGARGLLALLDPRHRTRR